MRVAIVHYWLLGMRGGERVVEALCRILPEAEIYTLFYDPDQVSPLIRSRVVHASFLNPARKYYRSLLPLMPFALGSFNLSGYDLVVSSESGPAKGVRVAPGARHVCYCHTPMRYLWDLYPAYLNDFSRTWLRRTAMALTAPHLRAWDSSSSSRVDQFVANSENVQSRIRRAWGRESTVVYPPVEVHDFYWKPSLDYFLIVSEFVPYKRLDYAIRLFSRMGLKLKIVGSGPEYRELKRLAGANVEFCGRVTAGELQELYSHARALVVPGEEDFGMTMVESLASGKPVIALRKGGACEIVTPECGILFGQPGEASLRAAINEMDRCGHHFDPARLQRRAAKFSVAHFDRSMRAILLSEGQLAPARESESAVAQL